MKLIKFHPHNVQPTFTSLFDSVLNDDFSGWFNNAYTVTKPAVNIIDSKDSFRIEVAAPGMNKNDFELSVNNDVLTIKAHKENSTEEKNERFTRKEFSSQSFERSFTLNDEIEIEKIEAQYNDGILNITLPKLEEVKKEVKRTIEIE